MEKLLSTDILENIFSRLPIEVALEAKRVCKTWKDVLRNYKSGKVGLIFVFSHEDNFEGRRRGIQQLFYGDEYDHYDRENMMNYYCSHDTLRKIKHGRFTTNYFLRNILVGSCNGLVCFGRYINYAWSEVPYLICNPFTRESVLLPEYNYSKFPLNLSATNRCTLASGFGYCPLTNKYKVVTIYYHEEEREGHVQVYTVGSGEWRYIGRSNSHYKFYREPVIYANGELYWFHHRNSRVQECGIAAFDLETEKFRYIQLPLSRDFAYKSDYTPLRLLGGNNNLYLIHINDTASRIWVYKRYKMSAGITYHDKISSRWIEEFIIPMEKLYRRFDSTFQAFAITRSNKVLFLHIFFGTQLYCYDPKTSTLNKLWDDDKDNDMRGRYIEAIPHSLSIVSLKDLGETSATSLKDFGQATEAKSGAERFLEEIDQFRRW